MSTLKKTTGLTGLLVSKSPHMELRIIYDKILRFAKLLPEDYAYRKSVENMATERNDILKKTADVATVEEKIGQGQVEELIVQAQRELNLLQNMVQVYKPWEKLAQEAPPNQWTWPPHK
ncbi:NADH dehydrogenase (ubiquinone) subunit ND-13B [Xylocopa sonorina]|uniref:NADH dehydrogenase (ubiquinone) subunit ND-13B n=1 Tax=Xylocopa sonorina TaxID=1818115 RepID=UPI00403AFDB1